MPPDAADADVILQLAERIAKLDRLENEVTTLRDALAAANEALTRREREDRRLRAMAVRETAEARAAGIREATRLRSGFEQRLKVVAANVEAQRALAQAALFERDQVLASASWRATWLLRKCAGLAPSSARRLIRIGLKATWWTLTGQLGDRLRRRRTRLQALAAPSQEPVADALEEEQPPTFDREMAEPADLRAESDGQSPGSEDAHPPADAPPSVEDLLDSRFAALRPLPVFPEPSATRRLTVVIDGLDASNLCGEGAAVLVLGALLAAQSRAELRLATRMERAGALALVDEVFRINGINWESELECLHVPGGSASRDAAVGSGDRFLAASWQGAWAADRSLPTDRIACLVLDDDCDSLLAGDDRLRRREALATAGLRLIVPAAGLERLQGEGPAATAIPFDLAFPSSAWAPKAKPDGDKHDFLFFGAPDDRDGLYWRGLEALALAMREGVLDPRVWTFTFVGAAACEVALPFGVRPKIVRSLAPRDYSLLLGGADLGLSLRAGRRLSHPALALAASGSVVVSSRFDREPSMSSDNILAVGTGISEVVEGLHRGASLAMDPAVRRRNYEQSRIQRDWRAALAPVLDRLGRWFDEG